ncbi:hypothetical protein [Novosphingobium huizhouense]|uniref:hypothetical protein n=1 Tax=Novosphingobium huizhouense TaxID=2866625 RepID=UPI001CD89C7B|nr:hypothetical protein [Novosphingobium huizhouense]
MAGLYPQEAAVMALWDRGYLIPAIACQTQLPISRIERIVGLYDDTGSEGRQRDMLRRGSAALLRAIQIARGR